MNINDMTEISILILIGGNRYHDPIYEKIKSVIGSQSKGKLQCERNEQSR